jgi:putative thioredoxin
VAAFVQRLAPPPSEADTLVAQGDEASLRKALELEPGHAGAIEALARLLIERGDAPEALTLLQRVPETEATRALAAQARLTEAGVDVSAGVGVAGIEDKLNALLERVRDDDGARQEYVDLLETMGADDPRTNEYRRALAARLY